MRLCCVEKQNFSVDQTRDLLADGFYDLAGLVDIDLDVLRIVLVKLLGVGHVVFFGYGSRFAQAGHRLLFGLLRTHLQTHQTGTADRGGLDKVRLLFRVVLNLVNDTFHMQLLRGIMCVPVRATHVYVTVNSSRTVGFTPD